MNPQRGGQWKGRPVVVLARFWLVGLDEDKHRLPGHHDIHLKEQLFRLACV